MKTKKLAAYSTMAGGLLLSAGKADAQIIYTDIDPDISLTLPHEDYEDLEAFADINNDGVDDFGIYATGYSGCAACFDRRRAFMRPLGLNELGYAIQNVYNDCFSFYFASRVVPAVLEGDVIGDDETFVHGSVNFFEEHYGTEAGCVFSDAGDEFVIMQYAPLKLNIDGSMHYAWMRYSVGSAGSAGTKVTLYDAAYNAVPGEPLAASIPDCVPPVVVSVSTGPSAAKLVWSPVGAASSYKIKYRKSGTASWTSVSTTLTSKKITGLECSTNYQYKIYSSCPGEGLSDPSPTAVFTTGVCRTGIENDISDALLLYPNPAATTLYAETGTFKNGPLKIEIFDIIGTQIYAMMITADENMKIDIADLPAGMYTINISDTEKSVAGQFVKQ